MDLSQYEMYLLILYKIHRFLSNMRSSCCRYDKPYAITSNLVLRNFLQTNRICIVYTVGLWKAIQTGKF